MVNVLVRGSKSPSVIVMVGDMESTQVPMYFFFTGS